MKPQVGFALASFLFLAACSQEDSTTDTVRIAVASFAMETCTFCPRPTDIEHFEFYGEPFTGDAVLESGGASQAFTRAASEYQDVEVIGVYAVRDPVGGSMGSWVTERAFDKFAGEIVTRLAAIDDLDAVYLPLHGAMAVTGIPRPEAELVRRIKAELGDIPIAITYDLHANEDAEIAEYADIVLIVKRFPHYDFGLMGERAARLLIRTVRGSYEPVLEVRRPNIAFATVYGGTHQGVPRDMMERARRWENRRPDVYVSVAMGFPFADVPDMGMSVFVQTNGDRALASEIADDMAQYIWNRRDEFEYDIPKLSEGVEQGLVALDAGKGPLVLANLSDRLGDATHILGQLLERGRSNFVVATILAGAPVVIDGVVSFIGAYDIGGSVESDLVALSFGDNNWVLLTPDRYQVTTRSILDHAGVPVDEMDIFVVKSRNHFRRGFMETGLAKAAVVIDAPGHGPADIGQLQFQNLPEGTYSRFLSE
jgi:microcystin degradation protein MlrC